MSGLGQPYGPPRGSGGRLLDYLKRGKTGQRPENLLIRGTNSLSGGKLLWWFLRDGIPYEGSIGDIDPNIVESLTVLKDASSD